MRGKATRNSSIVPFPKPDRYQVLLCDRNLSALQSVTHCKALAMMPYPLLTHPTIPLNLLDFAHIYLWNILYDYGNALRLYGCCQFIQICPQWQCHQMQFDQRPGQRCG